MHRCDYNEEFDIMYIYSRNRFAEVFAKLIRENIRGNVFCDFTFHENVFVRSHTHCVTRAARLRTCSRKML